MHGIFSELDLNLAQKIVITPRSVAVINALLNSVNLIGKVVYPTIAWLINLFLLL